MQELSQDENNDESALGITAACDGSRTAFFRLGTRAHVHISHMQLCLVIIVLLVAASPVRAGSYVYMSCRSITTVLIEVGIGMDQLLQAAVRSV